MLDTGKKWRKELLDNKRRVLMQSEGALFVYCLGEVYGYTVGELNTLLWKRRWLSEGLISDKLDFEVNYLIADNGISFYQWEFSHLPGGLKLYDHILFETWIFHTLGFLAFVETSKCLCFTESVVIQWMNWPSCCLCEFPHLHGRYPRSLLFALVCF